MTARPVVHTGRWKPHASSVPVFTPTASTRKNAYRTRRHDTVSIVGGQQGDVDTGAVGDMLRL
jgi:hypothetical protein